MRVGTIMHPDGDGVVQLGVYGITYYTEPLRALTSAPGSTLVRVENVGDAWERDGSKVVTNALRVLCDPFDAARVLQEFMLWCAEQALELIKNPDPRSLAVLEVKRRWLAGMATDKELVVARKAASDVWKNIEDVEDTKAAWYAARCAWRATEGLWYTATDVAWEARETVVESVWDGTKDAAEEAAWDAIKKSVWDVLEASKKTTLATGSATVVDATLDSIRKAWSVWKDSMEARNDAKKTARKAIRDVAWDIAWFAQSDQLERMFLAAIAQQTE